MTARIAVLMMLCLGMVAGCADTPRERREERREDRREEARDDAHDRKVERWSDWEKLGERRVDYKPGADKDTITVTASEGTFNKIAIKVEHSALELFNVKVFFGNGEHYSPDTRLIFREDSNSRIIDLPGDKRVIRKVEFHYKNLPKGGKAQLELWGHK